MELLTPELREKLLANYREQEPVRGTEHEKDFAPVVKLFNPVGAATWLLTELDPEDGDYAFGLCDLGMGFPELGYVSIGELARLQVGFCLGIERDIHFEAKAPISVYAREAHRAGRIVEDFTV